MGSLDKTYKEVIGRFNSLAKMREQVVARILIEECSINDLFWYYGGGGTDIEQKEARSRMAYEARKKLKGKEPNIDFDQFPNEWILAQLPFLYQDFLSDL